MTTTNCTDRLRDCNGTVCNVAGDVVLVPGELLGESDETARVCEVAGLVWEGSMVRVVLSDGSDALLDDLHGCQLVTDPWSRLQRMLAR